jgi:hypothetical protein
MNRRLMLLCCVLGSLVFGPLSVRAEDTAETDAAAADAARDNGPSAALRTYVDKPDDSYGWVIRREGALGGTKYAELT